MLVYNNKTGKILASIPDDQKPRKYNHISNNDISTLKLDTYQMDNKKYYIVVNGRLVRRAEEEILEIEEYGKILTEEERLNILLQPTHEEIAKAESTLEILLTLQEVGLI